MKDIKIDIYSLQNLYFMENLSIIVVSNFKVVSMKLSKMYLKFFCDLKTFS
jgi:hypothetical protein